MEKLIKRMKLKRYIFYIITLFTVLPLFGQRQFVLETTRYRIRYVINIPEIDSTFVDNAERMSDLREFLRAVSDDSLVTITDVQFKGTASPDGTYEFNVWLSENRLRTFKEFVRSYVDIPDDIIHANTSDIPWDEFRTKVEESDIPHKDEVLAIIDEEHANVPFWGNRHIDSRLLKLKRMYSGSVWETLKYPILHDLRYGNAVFTIARFLPDPIPDIPVQPYIEPPIEPAPVILSRTPHIYLKTNFIGLALLNANIGIEADLTRHWSVSLHAYYCAMDWFKSTIKFRNLSFYPEVRYWFRHVNNDGFFVGAHFGLSYFNYAFDGDYRYQDYRGRTPAIGGGLSLGYRYSISKNDRWRMEFSAGAGFYPIDYSVFHNTPDVKDGQWVERHKRNYVGPDQLSVSIVYTFDLKTRYKTYIPKGGEQR